MSIRLPAHLEVSALLRSVEAAGGFATVLSKGEKDAGTVLLLTTERGCRTRLWERMPHLDGSRKFEVTREQDPENPHLMSEYLDRRTRQDPDSWLLELDIADADRFIDSLGQ